jgi:hypothetical protein
MVTSLGLSVVCAAELLFFEASAFTGDCVEDVFQKTAAVIKDKMDSGLIDPQTVMSGVHPAAAGVEHKAGDSGGCAC